jgi:MraZ protein
VETIVQHLDPPQGMYPARLDDKGRLKLPSAFQQYFAALPERKLFVTSINRRTAQVYPIKAWRDNIHFLQEHHEHAKAARSVAFNAADLGAESEMDAQGRILFSPELRRELSMENQPVRLFAYRGRIEILNEATYEKMKLEASEVTPDDLIALEAAGLN